MSAEKMNTDNDVTKFIITLSELFPGTVSEVKARIYLNLLRDDLRHVDLMKLVEDIADRFKFFPTVLDIKDTLGTRKQTRRELATEFVDTILMVCQGSGNIYEIAGSDNANFWKEVTGMTLGQTKTDLHSGHLETRFTRGQWIDNAERAYIKHDENKKLAAANKHAQITGETVI